MSLIYDKLIRPILFRLPAETAHEIGLASLRLGLVKLFSGSGRSAIPRKDRMLEAERFGLRFANPIGLAAGFDKNGSVIDQMADLGFGFVEVGTVTLEPQPGNPKPRMFRLPADRALINRLGFNNSGSKEIAESIAASRHRCVVGINIGKNKDVDIDKAVENYIECFEAVHHAADYIAVNVSSPNTPNLRDLQRPENLYELISALQQRNRLLGAVPLLVKVAPDLSGEAIDSIVEACVANEVDGMIATNTTVARTGLRTAGIDRFGAGGLSGAPLFKRSNEVVSAIYKATKGKLPIIGVGGIFSASDAFEKIAAGASLVQVYTGFVYRGPGFARELSDGLDLLLRERGFSNLDEAVGSGVK